MAIRVVPRLASSLGRGDEVPNQELAGAIVAADDVDAVAELVDLLTNGSRAVKHDAIKVLYEIAYAKPTLIVRHANVFLDLLASKENRVVCVVVGTRPFLRCQGKILRVIPMADGISTIPSAVIPRDRSR